MLEVSEKEEGVVAPLGLLKTCFMLELVRRCESTSPLPDDLTNAPSGLVAENRSGQVRVFNVHIQVPLSGTGTRQYKLSDWVQ